MVSDGTVPYKTYLALPGLILTPPWTRDKAGRGQKQSNFRFLNPIISGSNHLIELLIVLTKELLGQADDKRFMVSL